MKQLHWVAPSSEETISTRALQQTKRIRSGLEAASIWGRFLALRPQKSKLVCLSVVLTGKQTLQE